VRLVRIAAVVVLAAGCPLVRAAPPAGAPDPVAAEREYRLARRLAAEGSPQAAAALERVVELDPAGSLADDALVELALLEGVASWPEQLGRLSAAGAERARERLRQVLEHLPRSDRAPQAELLAALLELEPFPGRDPAAARVRLLALATLHDDDEIAGPARYVVGWIDEHGSRLERARGTYERLLIDGSGTEAVARARVGLGRVALLEGRWAVAAERLQLALDLSAAGSLRAAELRELAVRSALRAAGAGGRWSSSGPARADTQMRGPEGFARTADGGIVASSRRQDLLRFIEGADGQWTDWRVEGPQTLTVDGLGRVLVAVPDGVMALDGGRLAPVGALGDFAPVSAMAADGLGNVWVADRRGERVGLLTPAAAAPVVLWSSVERRLQQLSWDGRRLLALDGKNDRLVEIRGDGTERPIELAPPLERPAWVSSCAGQTAVLDLRLQSVVLIGPDDGVLERFDYRSAGIDRPVAVALGPDGALDVLESDGIWTRLR